MNLLKIHQNVKRLFTKLWTVENQWEYYDGQKASIRELTLYPWYKYIVEYRESETEMAMNKLIDPKTPKEEISYRQAKCSCGSSFLSFLDNINAPSLNLE